ncbi:hypothetical protein B5P45_03510 [Phyllobacterium zundukense]|uniref:Uncharacterized protein n=1 Tax=Phyllobacterium zundukense TaxID=1867719 RepID=A0A2N9W372_9HYPH|nr:hypothetical protein BLM14_21895 [Phyllobacterium zundukense]PIO46190.1 hypothetical protein B5P45_03510 [Phyllobacterium zundukense]
MVIEAQTIVFQLQSFIVITQALVRGAQRSDVRFKLIHLADQTRNQPAHGTERQGLNRINGWQVHATLNQNSLRLKIYLPGNLVRLPVLRFCRRER